MPTASSLTWKTSLRKVRTLWHCSRLRSVWATMIDRDIRQAIDRCSNIWASLPGAGYGCLAIRLTAWLQNSKKRAERSEIDVWAESLRLFRSGYLHHRLPAAAVNHYRDNAITYKAQRDKNARELKLANAALHWHDASAWCCCARCKIHEGVSWC